MSSPANPGSVRFVLVDQQLKIFKHGLQALSKIGSELLIEALPGQFVLRTINTSRSAYMSLTFGMRFFDTYDVYNCEVVQAGLLLKHALAVFRSPRIRHLMFSLDSDACVVGMSVLCENGLKKAYRVSTMTAEILQASVDKSSFPISLVAETTAFARLLSTFHAGVDEITLVSHPDAVAPSDGSVQIHSFVDPLKGSGDDMLITQLSVDARRAFLHYTNVLESIGVVTFNLKDFRAMVTLCEQLGTNLLIRCEGPGLPLVLEPTSGSGGEWDRDFEAELILATLVADDDATELPVSQTVPAPSCSDAQATRGGRQTSSAQHVPPGSTHDHGVGLFPRRGPGTLDDVPEDDPSDWDPHGAVMGTPPEEQATQGRGPAGVIALSRH